MLLLSFYPWLFLISCSHLSSFLCSSSLLSSLSTFTPTPSIISAYLFISFSSFTSFLSLLFCYQFWFSAVSCSNDFLHRCLSCTPLPDNPLLLTSSLHLYSSPFSSPLLFTSAPHLFSSPLLFTSAPPLFSSLLHCLLFSIFFLFTFFSLFFSLLPLHHIFTFYFIFLHSSSFYSLFLLFLHLSFSVSVYLNLSLSIIFIISLSLSFYAYTQSSKIFPPLCLFFFVSFLYISSSITFFLILS